MAKALAFDLDDDARMALIRRVQMAAAMRGLMAGLVALGSPALLASAAPADLDPALAFVQHCRGAPSLSTRNRTS